MRVTLRLAAVLSAIGLSLSTLQVRGDLITGGHDHDAMPPVVGEGERLRYIAPHHAPGDGFHEDHYFLATGDVHHFAWFSATPATPGPITIKYDFRALPGPFGANLITPGQMLNATAALTAWSMATMGKVVFMLDPVAPASAIINIGTGDLAALGPFVSGPGGILGLGGGTFTHGAVHSITGGVAWQDFLDTWDEAAGPPDVPGTFDYFTVVAQEIGHALGLGHTDNDGSSADDMMDGFYTLAKGSLSADDISHITSVYGVKAAAVVPEPASLSLLGIGGMALLGYRLRGRKRAA